jgi:hypothetical protein
MLSRLFAYLTLFMYLTVGVVVVRVYMPETTTVEISTSYLKYFSKTEFKAPETDVVAAPEMNFAEIKFPVEKKIIAKKPVAKKVVVENKPVKMETVSKHELPFHEIVELRPVVMKDMLPVNHVALYNDYKYEAIASTPVLEVDEVTTKLASDAEPEFFEYPVEEVKVAEASAPATKEEVAPTPEAVNQESTNPQIAKNVEEVNGVDKGTEEVALDELISFDYSQATQDLKEEKVQAAVAVTTQPVAKAAAPALTASVVTKTKTSKKKAPVTTQEENALTESSHGFMASNEESQGYTNRVTIQVTGTDFKSTQQEVGFEVRPQDDLGETFSDYNNGDVVIDQVLAQPKMTRAITVLKRGFVPTNTDLILEEGVSEVSLPLIEEGTFNELLAPFESRGPIGAVLVELEDNVESATLDVPYSKVLKLDENMKVTEDSVFSYQLFVGVKAGNALLSYKDDAGDITSKIIHVHEHELTFESNFFEEVENEKFSLVEEDLLSKEKTPLIISSDLVRQFATEKTAKKINDHTYKTHFNKTLLGGRKYLELGHQEEPVFVGFKEASKLEIPSENFMRYILSKFEGNKLGNRCLVQINLNKKAVRVDVSPESAGQSLQTYTQVLDSDGKFYDSVGEKSMKVIVVGENHGSQDYSQDAKINFKVHYQDGTVQYLGSYCSPNTYLIEQL